MAIKVVQKVKRITANASTPTLSDPIALKSGYLRVSTGSTPIYVETGIGTPVATVDSFHLGPFGNEVLKERIARQSIVGITTGASTVVIFDNNAGNPFLAGDYASIENVTTAGIGLSGRALCMSTAMVTIKSVMVAADCALNVGSSK